MLFCFICGLFYMIERQQIEKYQEVQNTRENACDISWIEDSLKFIVSLQEDRGIDRKDPLARVQSREFCSIDIRVPENVDISRLISTFGNQGYEWEIGGLWKPGGRTLEIVKGHGRSRYGRSGFQNPGIDKNQWDPLIERARSADLLFHTHPIYASVKDSSRGRSKYYSSERDWRIAEMQRIVSHAEVEIQNWDILQKNHGSEFCLPSIYDISYSLQRRKAEPSDFCEHEIISAEGWNCYIKLNHLSASPEELLAAGPALPEREQNFVRQGECLSRIELVRAKWSAEQIKRFYELFGISARVERVEPYIEKHRENCVK